MMRFKLRTLLIGVTATCVLLGWIVWMTPEFDGDYYAVQRISLRDDRELIIWTEWSRLDPNIPVCYEIRCDQGTLVRRFSLTLAFTKMPQFDVVQSADGDAIGCFDRSRPDDLLCVYEFSSGEGWPGGEMWSDKAPIADETIALKKQIRERITQKLRSRDRAKGRE